MEDLTDTTRYPGTHRKVYRPLVEVTLGETKVSLEQKIPALVDSGSEHTLFAPWVARAAGLDIGTSNWEMNLRLGGEVVHVSFIECSLRLHPPGGSLDSFIEWETEIGFVDHFRVSSWSAVMGQIGFFDRFTVTMQRTALTLVVDEFEALDSRFGELIRLAEENRPRFLP